MSQHHRPAFHVHAAAGWVNDPNAPIEVDGRYHLFCQHNPGGTSHGDIHWAHFSSPDLAHWSTHPTALAPRPGGPDADGCWSGSAVMVDGAPWLVYSGRLDGQPHQTVCLARPTPGLEQWDSEALPVLASAPEGAEVAEWRDPFVWLEQGEFRLLMGAGYVDRTGAALLYGSADLRSWQPLGALCSARDAAFDAYDTGDAWECPQLLRRGNRGLLVLSVWRQDTGPDHVAYASGTLTGGRLDVSSVARLDAGPDFYAPALTVDSTGRCLLWGWSWEARDEADIRADGWAGCLTVPRVLDIAADGTPRMSPAPELAALRSAGREMGDTTLVPGQPVVVDTAAGRSVDIAARLSPGTSGRAWLRVLAAPDASEWTEVGVEGGTGDVYLCRDRSSAAPGALGGTYRMPVGLGSDGAVDLRIIVDGSIVEVFAGDGHALTARVYPGERSAGLMAGADDAGARVSVQWWRLAGGGGPGAE